MIDAQLARRLVATQFPQWADLPVRPVDVDGWDHRSFRLGDDMSIRLPSAAGYEPQVAKEHRWLPVLAPHLPLPVPVPLARGQAGCGYPFEWTVHPWLDGEDARSGRIDDPVGFATDLAGFLAALARVDPTGGPPAGRHSAYRGGPLLHYDGETRRALDALRGRIDSGRIDTAAATAVWDAALAATPTGPPVWFHGDVAAGNLLVADGRLAGVIDFGCAGVGDPACDTTVAWTLFSGVAREAFRAGFPGDAATWARGRGWALWKAVVTLAERPDAAAEHVIMALLEQ